MWRPRSPRNDGGSQCFGSGRYPGLWARGYGIAVVLLIPTGSPSQILIGSAKRDSQAANMKMSSSAKSIAGLGSFIASGLLFEAGAGDCEVHCDSRKGSGRKFSLRRGGRSAEGSNRVMRKELCESSSYLIPDASR